VRVFYYGPEASPGAHVGQQGELRIVSLVGLWDKVRAAIIDGGILRLAHEPVMAYLQEAARRRPDCLLCGAALEADAHPISMMVFMLPYRPAREPVMVAAMCGPCCDAERDDDKLLARVETVLQQHAIVK
jgi:hypothetical protein